MFLFLTVGLPVLFTGGWLATARWLFRKWVALDPATSVMKARHNSASYYDCKCPGGARDKSEHCSVYGRKHDDVVWLGIGALALGLISPFVGLGVLLWWVVTHGINTTGQPAEPSLSRKQLRTLAFVKAKADQEQAALEARKATLQEMVGLEDQLKLPHYEPTT